MFNKFQLKSPSSSSAAHMYNPAYMSLDNIEEEIETSSLPCRRFSLSEVQSATNNFNEALVIGRGGFGVVYKGFFDDEHSTATAIKRLDPNSNQGAHEFWTEIAMLSKFRHCNLVSLIGYCNDNGEMVIVYEYMPCGTLYDHLHKMSSRLSWIQLLKVCIGAARGLDYLHTGTSTQHRIIHRDVKTSNILLDENLQAKVSDFGLSKVGPADQACSFVNTYIKGSFGYLDPEYFLSGRLTRKSDVYSFGVVLFEVLCGRRAVDTGLSEEQHNLAKWVQNRIKHGNIDEIIDPNLLGKILPDCLKEFAKIGEQCLHKRSKRRPTMAEVVARLESALALQEKTDSLTDEEMLNDSSDSDNEENTDYSFTEGEKSNDAENDDNQPSMDSPKEHEIIGISGNQDEWILGTADKVMSFGAFEDQHNTETSFIEGELIDKARDSETEENTGFVLEEEVIDVDTGDASGSGIVGGGHEDTQTSFEASGGQSKTEHATKMTLTRKLKNFFFTSAALTDTMTSRSKSNKTNNDNSGSSKEKTDVQEVPLGRHVLTRDLKIFSFDELDSAKQNFKQENFLGQGDDGPVYEGWVHNKTYSPSMLEGEMAVAVKRLIYPQKLISERLGQYCHANFDKLLGYCLEDKECFPVYEFMENGSLASHLFESAETLPWFTRIKILLGAARGLGFLHTTMEVSSNKHFGTQYILLDGDFCNSYPYAPPETYKGAYDMMSDVFVFGVVILETLTGLQKYTLGWKTNKDLLMHAFLIIVDELDTKDVWSMVDPRLERNYARKGAVMLAKLAQRCLQDAPGYRPSMEQVLRDLERINEVEMQPDDWFSWADSYLLPNARSGKFHLNHSSPRSP